MRIINIEDCLELMCGLLIEEEFTPAIEIAEKDKKLLLKDKLQVKRTKLLLLCKEVHEGLVIQVVKQISFLIFKFFLD